jgi:hypothetical protein
MPERISLTEDLLSDLAFQVRWHFSYKGVKIQTVLPIVSGPVELGMQEPTEVPSFLSDFSNTDLFEVDFVAATLSNGEKVQIIDYFSKARSKYYGRAFVVSSDVMMEKKNDERWVY